jgi:hypothetical protein
MTATTTEVRLTIPIELSGCATWLLSQSDPAVVADALQLCEIAFNTLRRGVCDTESERLVFTHNTQVLALQAEVQQERDKTHTLVNELRQASDASVAADRLRHKAALDVLQRQMGDSSAAHQMIQTQLLEERSSHSLAHSIELKATIEEYDGRLAQQVKSSVDERALQLSTMDQENTSLREGHQCMIDSLQKERRSLTEQLCVERSTQQQSIDDAQCELRSRLEREASHLLASTQVDTTRRFDVLRSEISNLNAELKNKQGCEAMAREEVRNQCKECMASQTTAHVHAIEELKMQLRQRGDEHLQSLASRDEAQRKDAEWLKEELKRRSESLEIALAAKDIAAFDFSKRVEALASENREVLSCLSGSHARGRIGEHMVESTFSRLQMGTWQDDSSNPAEGFADALWEFCSTTGAPKLSALIEVKNVAALHSQKDIAKFHNDMASAIASNRANAGMFFSLSARFPGTRPLHICIMHGVPVCVASRSADDPMPATSLIELAFHAMAEVWPMICRQRGSGVEGTILAAAEHYDRQLQDMDKLSKRIISISRLSVSLAREAKGLERLRDDWSTGIERLRHAHPQLVPEAFIEEEDTRGGVPEELRVGLGEELGGELGGELVGLGGDPWSSPGALDLFLAINAFKGKQSGRKRYPKHLSDLTLTTEAQTFINSMQNSLETANEKLKRAAAVDSNKERANKKRKMQSEEDKGVESGD